MNEKKSKVKYNKKEITLKDLIKIQPDFEQKLSSVTKAFSEKVQELVRESSVEATIKVSFSFKKGVTDDDST